MVRAGFQAREHSVGSELRLADNPVAGVLLVLMNDPVLFRLIRRVTGCGPIGSFTGRVYRMAARRGQAFTWHNDLQDDRKVAIPINLSDAPYRGGTLEIRDRSRGAREVIPNLGFGDAIIFPVVENLVHRVTPVVGKVSKTAYSGWFCSRPKYTSVHRHLVARSESAIAPRANRKRERGAPLSPRDAVKISSAVVSQTTGDETFVANIGTGTCYGFE